MDGVDVGVQPLAPLRCCSAAVHPRQGIACLHPGFWVFGSHLPGGEQLCLFMAAPAPGVTPHAAPACLGHPSVPGEEATWPCTGNDLALYWCSLSFPWRGRFCSLMHAGTAGAADARELARVRGGLPAVAPAGGGCCQPRLPPSPGGVLLVGPSLHPRGCELCVGSDPLAVSGGCFSSCSPSFAPPGAFPLAFLVLFKFNFLAALQPSGFCIWFSKIQGGPGTKHARHWRALQRPLWFLLGV